MVLNVDITAKRHKISYLVKVVKLHTRYRTPDAWRNRLASITNKIWHTEQHGRFCSIIPVLHLKMPEKQHDNHSIGLLHISKSTDVICTAQAPLDFCSFTIADQHTLRTLLHLPSLIPPGAGSDHLPPGLPSQSGRGQSLEDALFPSLGRRYGTAYHLNFNSIDCRNTLLQRLKVPSVSISF